MTPAPPYRRWGVTAALAVTVGAVYYFTTARSVGFIDSGELSTVARTLGIAHPTGYPLFTILARLATLAVPGLPVIFRLNLFSALVSVAAVAVFFHFLCWILATVHEKSGGGPPREKKTTFPGGRVSENRPEIVVPALFGALTLAFSETFWSQATAVEVYPLHCLFLVVLLFLFLRTFLPARGGAEKTPVAGERGECGAGPTRGGLLFAYVLGLSFTNHMTTIYLAPAFLYLFFRTCGAGPPSRRFLIRLIPVFLLGLSAYLYLPVRASAGAVVNWGDPTSPEAILRHLSGRQYSVWIFSSAETAMKQLRYFFSTYGGEFWYLPLFLAIGGLRVLHRRNRRLSAFILLLLGGCIVFAVNYDIHDIDSYFLLAYIATAALAAAGLFGILTSPGGRRVRLAVAVLAIAFTGGQAVRNYPTADQSGLTIVGEYTRSILDATGPGGMVISYQWDYFVSASYYYQMVEGHRPDVIVIDKELLRRSWYFEYLERRYPGLVSASRSAVDPYLRELYRFENDLPYDPRVIEQRYTGMIAAFIGRHIRTGAVYVTPEIEPAYTAGYLRIPHGLTFRLARPDDGIGWEHVPLGLSNPRPDTRLLDGITMLHAQAELNSAIYLLQEGRTAAAREAAGRAVGVRPDYADARALLQRLREVGGP